MSSLGRKIHVHSKQVCKETVRKYDSILYSLIFQSRGQSSRIYKKLALEALETFTSRLLQNQSMHECAMLVADPPL